MLTPSYWRARKQLHRLTRPAHQVVAAALPPVQRKLRDLGSRKYVEQYVAAQQARQSQRAAPLTAAFSC